MPRYDYQCSSCGVHFEAVHKMSDPPLTVCPCGKEGQVTRLMSAGSGLIFKGSGFYITDYKKSSSSPAAAGTAGEGSGSSATPAPASGNSAPAPAPTTTPAPAAPSSSPKPTSE
jgi:putative FmdB family regulatory protein